MKKLLAVLTVLAVVSVSSKAFAAPADGGTVNLTNYDSNNPIFFGTTATRLPTAGALVQVLGGPQGGAIQVLANGTGLNMFTLTEPGFFDGGFGAVPGTAENGQASLQVRAWVNGTSFATATGGTGATAVYNNALGSNPALPNLPVPAANTMPSFTVLIPEPSTVILGLLGAGALLFRRRK